MGSGSDPLTPDTAFHSNKTKTIMPFKTWQCFFCGYAYDEAKGWPDDGIAPGTRWEDVAEDWACPECGAMKSDFYMIEV